MTGRGPIAIVGMGVNLPGAPDLDRYWHNLCSGVDAITEVPAGRHDTGFHDDGPDGPERTYCHRGGFVSDRVEVDLRRLGIMPHSVAEMEPDQLIALGVAAAALADAGGIEAVADPSRIGVVLGRGGYLSPALARYEQRVRTIPTFVRLVRELRPDMTEDELEGLRVAALDGLGPHSPESTIGLVPNLAASRLSNRLDLRGPAYTVDAACASSLVAVDHAMTELAGGRCDAVLAGGVHHCHDETLWSTFTQLGALSRTGISSPLSGSADGLLIGEGSGIVVLKRLADAERDGNRIYAVVTGVGVASDGRSASLFAPDSGGQETAVRAAWREARHVPCYPGSVGMIEAHGTGTRAGDDAELTTLASVFGPRTECHSRAVIGSVKSMIGHTMPAAGVASLVKAALAVHHAVRLPTLHCEEPNPLLARTRFDVLRTAEPWPASLTPRRVGVNAFGFGGINAHVLVEQHEPARLSSTPVLPVRTAGPVVVDEPERVVRVAAPDLAALAAQLDVDDDELVRGPVGLGPCRVAVVGAGERQLATARKVVDRALGGGPLGWRGRADVWFSADPLRPEGRTVFVFPGLEAAFAHRCDDVARWLGAPPPPAEVDAGVNVLAHADAVMDVGRLLADACRRIGVVPDAAVGHSVGEWSAMAVAGMFGPAGSGTDPAAVRHRFFTDGFGVPDVEFAALGCDVEQARRRVDRHPGVVLSHDNAPRQTVVCGPDDAIGRLVAEGRADGLVCRRLPFRSGFHTPMLDPFLQPFRTLAAHLPMHPPTLPVWSCAGVTPFDADPDRSRDLYLRHLVEPVRFREVVEQLWSAGNRLFVVLGPGQVGGFVSDTLGDRAHSVVSAASSARSGMAQLTRVAAAHWVEGGSPSGEVFGGRAGDDARPVVRAACSPVRSQEVTVRLGVAPLSLGERAARRWAATVARPAPRTVHEVPDEEGLPDVVARQLAALRAETEASTSAVLSLLARPLDESVGVARTRPAERMVAVTGPFAESPGAPGPVAASPAAPPASGDGLPGRDRSEPVDQRLVTVEVSLAAMPHLRDHCFFRQRADWPDEVDRRPVVPATAIIDLAIAQVNWHWPALEVRAVREARFDRWLIAEPAQRITVALRRSGDTVEVTVGDYARLCLSAAPGRDTPQRLAVPADDAPPTEGLRHVYGRRLMFHGPGYQGIQAVIGVGRGHARARLVVPDAPGALLDNVGQLLGIWMFAHLDEKLLAFPQRIEEIRLEGALPPAGETVDCLVLPRCTDDSLRMDAQLTHRGRVVATIRGWQDVRLDCDRHTHRAYAFPDRCRHGSPMPGGWILVRERWHTAAARDLHAGAQLGSAEREIYARLDPRRRRQWLLGRIAAKDAVREFLGEISFPAELRIDNDPSGRPTVVGVHRTDPAADVSLAHTSGIGVALAAPRGAGPGIDVEPVHIPSPGTLDSALDATEKLLYEQRSADGSGTWFSRLWTAKEAVAKARGTGLQGRPRAFRVLEADADGALVADPDGVLHRVHHHQIVVDDVVHIVAHTIARDDRVHIVPGSAGTDHEEIR